MAGDLSGARLEVDEFEAMLHYEDALTERLLDAVAAEIGVPREAVLEDIGTYLVSNPNVEALRRLLRFGGENFVEFLHSLDELPDRRGLRSMILACQRLSCARLRSAGLPSHAGFPSPGSGMS